MNANQFAKLLDRVDNLARQNPTLRWGQCLFNELDEHFPMIALSLRGTSLDPYYKATKAQCEFTLSYLWEKVS